MAIYCTESSQWTTQIGQLFAVCAPDCKSVVLGSNPAPPQHTANSVSPEAGSHLGWHSTVCWPLRGGRGTHYTQKPLKIYRKKKLWHIVHLHWMNLFFYQYFSVRNFCIWEEKLQLWWWPNEILCVAGVAGVAKGLLHEDPADGAHDEPGLRHPHRYRSAVRPAMTSSVHSWRHSVPIVLTCLIFKDCCQELLIRYGITV